MQSCSLSQRTYNAVLFFFQTGILFASGILLFSGSCYYAGLTGRTKYRWITPLGGAVLILAWASFIV